MNPNSYIRKALGKLWELSKLETVLPLFPSEDRSFSLGITSQANSILKKVLTPSNKMAWNHSRLLCLPSIIARHRRPFLNSSVENKSTKYFPVWDEPLPVYHGEFSLSLLCFQTLDQCLPPVATKHERAWTFGKTNFCICLWVPIAQGLFSSFQVSVL